MLGRSVGGKEGVAEYCLGHQNEVQGSLKDFGIERRVITVWAHRAVWRSDWAIKAATYQTTEVESCDPPKLRSDLESFSQGALAHNLLRRVAYERNPRPEQQTAHLSTPTTSSGRLATMQARYWLNWERDLGAWLWQIRRTGKQAVEICESRNKPTPACLNKIVEYSKFQVAYKIWIGNRDLRKSATTT